MHYVYQLRLSNKEQPFYIGKGMGDRAYCHLNGKTGDNKHKNNTINKAKRDGVEILIEFIFTGLDEDEALRREVWAIKMWGRKDLKEGPLTNKTDGGEGVSGARWTVDSKARHSDTIKDVWKDPEYRKQQTESRTYYQDESFKEGLRQKANEQWANADELKRCVGARSKARMTGSTPHRNLEGHIIRPAAGATIPDGYYPWSARWGFIDPTMRQKYPKSYFI